MKEATIISTFHFPACSTLVIIKILIWGTKCKYGFYISIKRCYLVTLWLLNTIFTFTSNSPNLAATRCTIMSITYGIIVSELLAHYSTFNFSTDDFCFCFVVKILEKKIKTGPLVIKSREDLCWRMGYYISPFSPLRHNLAKTGSETVNFGWIRQEN